MTAPTATSPIGSNECSEHLTVSDTPVCLVTTIFGFVVALTFLNYKSFDVIVSVQCHRLSGAGSSWIATR